MHSSQFPVSAIRMFDREHTNIHEIVRWATKGPLVEAALPSYSDIIWDGMPILSGRLDILEREEFCEVGHFDISYLLLPILNACFA